MLTIEFAAYKYGVYSLDGRLWARTLTRLKAARAVEMLYTQRGLSCVVRPLTGGTK